MNLILFLFSGLRCVLHKTEEGQNSGKILLFTAEKLQKCWEVKRLRDESTKKKSHFDSFKLPNDVDCLSGYHSQCYRYYQCSVKRPKTETGTNTNTYITDFLFYFNQIILKCIVLAYMRWATEHQPHSEICLL